MGTYFSQADLERLHALRETLIGIEGRPAGEEAPRYWASKRDIALYDRVLAPRIGWKWEGALDDTERRGGLPSPSRIVDIGTGTGIAARTVLRRIVAAGGSPEVHLFDRDPGVLDFAHQAVRGEFPGLTVHKHSELPETAEALVLVSHVLNELEPGAEGWLMDAVRAADAALWVEPGSKRTSRRLTALRADLLGTFDVVAPCTHREACGIMAEAHKSDWCHLFAKPPAEVHTTGEWSEVHRELRIDLRSLPYAFLALVKGGAAHMDDARVLGRPRFQKGRVLLDLCDAAGVQAEAMLQRTDKALFKALKDTAGETVLVSRGDGTVTPRFL